MKNIYFIVCFTILIVFSPTSVFAANFVQYINNPPPPVSLTTQTQPVANELENHIASMLIDQNKDGKPDHLAPAGFNHGGSARFGFQYWGTPGELLSALSQAYPYLSPALKTKVKAYLDVEMVSYDPTSVPYFEPNTNKLGDQPGVRREPYPIDTTHGLNFWPGPPMMLLVAYPIWQYTYYTGDRRYIDDATKWNNLVSLYNQMKSSGGPRTFVDIMGLAGFSRLATLKGNTTLANESANLADAKLVSSSFSSIANNTESQQDLYRDTFAVFMDGKVNSSCCTSLFIGIFAPELGWYLHDNRLSDIKSYSDRIEKTDPLWYMTLPNWGGDITGNTNMENLYAPPHIGWTNFMIHAYALKDSQEQLISYLDFPSRIGDLFYIQQLVATITSIPTSNDPTNTPITKKVGDANGDGQVNGQDYILWVNNYGINTNNGSSQGDFNGDLKVNGSDYILWLTNYGK